jgi:hypothetical protein
MREETETEKNTGQEELGNIIYAMYLMRVGGGQRV